MGIVAPKSRQRKLNDVMSQSHYIGAPMYMEAKVQIGVADKRNLLVV